MKEHAIGEIFELDGRRFECKEVVKEGCKVCAFDPLHEHNPLAVHCGDMRCEPHKRDDDRHVRFKEIK